MNGQCHNPAIWIMELLRKMKQKFRSSWGKLRLSALVSQYLLLRLNFLPDCDIGHSWPFLILWTLQIILSQAPKTTITIFNTPCDWSGTKPGTAQRWRSRWCRWTAQGRRNWGCSPICVTILLIMYFYFSFWPYLFWSYYISLCQNILLDN